MAGKRLNDTRAVAAMPISGGMRKGESINIDVRPIDNGYVKRECRYDDNGKYTSKEVYSPDRPEMSSMGEKSSGASMMKTAVDYIKK